MQPVIDSLEEFSKGHNLWQHTLECGRKCIANWISENSEEYHRLFPKQALSDFHFKDGIQYLIFNQNGTSTFILRTKYSLFTDNQQNKVLPVGIYALDVNQNGETVDDWLHFD